MGFKIRESRHLLGFFLADVPLVKTLVFIARTGGVIFM